VAENQEDRSNEDLSDEISQYRLEEYRRKGHVAQSREISGLAALLAAGMMTYALGPRMQITLMEFMQEVFRTDLMARLDLAGTHILRNLLEKGLMIVVLMGLPVAAAGFALGALASFAQIGSIFSSVPITPDFSKIDPIGGFKRMFSMRQFVNGWRLILKMVAVFFAVISLIKAEVLRAPVFVGSDPSTVLLAFGEAAKWIFLAIIGILAVFAAIDYFFQRREYNRGLRMTKAEAKQEHREREGDPQIKARVRSIQREMARRRMMQAVKTADVIVTNPTHIAVAILYAKNEMAAPKVVAKGADFLAQKIKQLAADAGVPMVENVPLARTLFKTVKVGHAVPRALYQAVAEVLAYVYRLRKKEV